MNANSLNFRSFVYHTLRTPEKLDTKLIPRLDRHPHVIVDVPQNRVESIWIASQR